MQDLTAALILTCVQHAPDTLKATCMHRCCSRSTFFACLLIFATSSWHMSSSSKSSDSDSSSQLTGNAGDSSDYDEEAPADQTMRGQAALVTAACPRQYHRTLEERRRANKLIPEDISTEGALRQFRRVWNSCCTAQLLKATCHDEPHKRVRQSTNKRRCLLFVLGLVASRVAGSSPWHSFLYDF